MIRTDSILFDVPAYSRWQEAVAQLFVALADADAATREQHIANYLHQNVPHYDWFGFYWTAPDAPDELVLGAFAGEPTEHTRIKFGEGVCGSAAKEQRTLNIPDVNALDNYLACSLATKSELVVPIFQGKAVMGEVDIDSHRLDAFSADDELFCGWLARQLSATHT